MGRSTFVLSMALAATVVACDRLPTASEQALPDASFNSSNGPDAPGESGVFRSSDGGINLAHAFLDEGLVVRHYQADDTFRCGGAEADPLWDVQLITNPEEQVDAIVRVTHGGEIPVVIYPLRDPSVGFCDWVSNYWLYRGTGSFVNQDNNVFYDDSRPLDVYGLQGHGQVEDRDGIAYRFSEVWRIVVSVAPLADRRFYATPDKLTLTPIRGGRP